MTCFWKKAFVALAVSLLGLSAVAQNYDDGLPRSTPEAEGIPSEVIADFLRALDDAVTKSTA